MLDDHRRFARATMATIAVLALAAGGALGLVHRVGAGVGLGVGAAIGEVDVLLLQRTLSRLGGRLEVIGARAVTLSLLVRFVLVSATVGAVLCARGLDPLGVVAGVLLLPLALVVVGTVAAWRAGVDRPSVGVLL